MRAYEDVWAPALTPLRHDLEPAEVRGVAVLTLLDSSAVSSLDVTSEVRAQLLRRMTLAALPARRTPRRS